LFTKKTFAAVVSASVLTAGLLSACADSVTIAEQTTIITPKAPSSVIVCRSQQCGPARTNMTREFLYNSLFNLLDNNLSSVVMLCDADPTTRMCLENYLQFDLKVGASPAKAVIDSAKLFNVKWKKNEQIIDASFEYNLLFNGIKPVCQPSNNAVFVKSPDLVLMEDTGFKCKFTTVGSSLVSTVFAIDYVDLDYGVIGANYSIGVSGPALGGTTGYALLRFQKNALPSDPKKFVFPKPTMEEGAVNPQRTPYPDTKQKLPSEKIAPGKYKVSPLPLK